MVYSRITIALPLAVLVFLASTVHAQFYPPAFDYRHYPPIHHDVPFHAQNTIVWCWVAVAKMVAEYYSRGPVPSQCEMLERHYGYPCCASPMGCTRPGHIVEVQGLLGHFGRRGSTLAPPANGFALYDALRRGPIILHTTQGGGHFIVATGMRLQPSPMGPLGIVLVHDPIYGRQSIEFPRLMNIWSAAVLVQ
ncbi:MAG TPA: papain-like cysteine protease family protein [Candidatus Binatia bacterium]|nr:papain-like cysteine protease family protein [Candidatus Binatia bacterium]